MPETRMLEFRSGGWVLLLAALVAGAFLARMILPSIGAGAATPVGDKKHAASYGFDLGNLQVPADTLVPGNMPKDGIPVLDRPALLTPAEVLRRNDEQRGKYLVPGDWVLGLSVGGEYRAYPIRVLNWHELVNDRLGGRPVAVAFNPLSFTAAAFDRERNGEVLTFGVSGLLWNSSMLLYDRREDGVGESLWLPLWALPVAGPAVEDGAGGLKVLPLSLTTWGDWVREHPGTTVPAGAPNRRKNYGMDPYGPYYQRGIPRFPVSPPLSGDRSAAGETPGAMTRCLVYRNRDGSYVLPLLPGPAAKAALPADLRGRVQLTQVGGEIHVDLEGGENIPGDLLYAFWFAVRADRPSPPVHGRSNK